MVTLVLLWAWSHWYYCKDGHIGIIVSMVTLVLLQAWSHWYYCKHGHIMSLLYWGHLYVSGKQFFPELEYADSTRKDQTATLTPVISKSIFSSPTSKTGATKGNFFPAVDTKLFSAVSWYLKLNLFVCFFSASLFSPPFLSRVQLFG